MTAGAVKKSPVIVVKKKRQIAPVTENVPAAPDREGEKIPSAVSESPVVVSPQPQTHPPDCQKNSASTSATNKDSVRFVVTISATDDRSCPSSAWSFLSSGLKTTLSALLRSVFSVMPKPLLTKTLTAVSLFSTVAAFSPGLLRHYPISVSSLPVPFVMTFADNPPAPSLKGTSSTHARPVNAFSVFSNKKRLRHN